MQMTKEPKIQTSSFRKFEFWISDSVVLFVSDFELRISDFNGDAT
jgi:hypothetical protein